MRAPVLLAVLSLLSVGQGGPHWPDWAKDLAAQLKCGMTLEDLDRLTEQPIEKRGFGEVLIGQGRASLSLQLDPNDRVQTIRLIRRPDGWRLLATRSSPERNLCTGQLTFIIRIIRTVDLEGSEVYLDGLKVEESEMKGDLLRVPAGEHELRFEKKGYEPIVKRLILNPEDRGDQRVDLSEERLQPRGGVP
ncbi:MAG TPA: PEGA domain-containing protein [Acidimicrobiia bacterium]|nr:PEGA domain-containing protein [Acidimicrobiia bacterium]